MRIVRLLYENDFTSGNKNAESMLKSKINYSLSTKEDDGTMLG
jgi:hypothetical protein